MFLIIKPCVKSTRANYVCIVLPALLKYINYVYFSTHCDLFLSPKEINYWIKSYDLFEGPRQVVLKINYNFYK